MSHALDMLLYLIFSGNIFSFDKRRLLFLLLSRVISCFNLNLSLLCFTVIQESILYGNSSKIHMENSPLDPPFFIQIPHAVIIDSPRTTTV